MLFSTVRTTHRQSRTRTLTQDMHIKSLPILDNGMTRIVSTSRATAQLRAIAQHIDNLSFALVAPLGPQHYGGHRVGLEGVADIAQDVIGVAILGEKQECIASEKF